MRIWISIFLLLSSNAFACPDLSGLFVCSKEDVNGFLQKDENIITHAVVDGVSVYSVKNSDGNFRYIADGKKRPMAYEDGQISFECTKDNKLLQKMYFKDVNYIVETSNLSFMDDGYIRSIGTHKISYEGENISTDHSHISCQKIDSIR